jgi:hypothetical protein
LENWTILADSSVEGMEIDRVGRCVVRGFAAVEETGPVVCKREASTVSQRNALLLNGSRVYGDRKQLRAVRTVASHRDCQQAAIVGNSLNRDGTEWPVAGWIEQNSLCVGLSNANCALLLVHSAPAIEEPGANSCGLIEAFSVQVCLDPSAKESESWSLGEVLFTATALRLNPRFGLYGIAIFEPLKGISDLNTMERISKGWNRRGF